MALMCNIVSIYFKVVELMNDEKLHPCPCCGYLTLNQPPPGTYLICPICCWEDNGEPTDEWDYWWSTSNKEVSLERAQTNFLEFGACDLEWLDYVRPPTGDDIRDPNWETIKVLKEKTQLALTRQIATVFDGVSLEDGISLHAARALDEWCHEESARKICRSQDREVRWQDVSTEKLNCFRHDFVFMDSKGFRFYLPAYMSWAINTYSTRDANFSTFIIDFLKDIDDYHRDYLELLNPAQKQTVLDVLQFFERLYTTWS